MTKREDRDLPVQANLTQSEMDRLDAAVSRRRQKVPGTLPSRASVVRESLMDLLRREEAEDKSRRAS